MTNGIVMANLRDYTRVTIIFGNYQGSGFIQIVKTTAPYTPQAIFWGPPVVGSDRRMSWFSNPRDAYQPMFMLEFWVSCLCECSIEEGIDRQVKVLIKNLAIFFLCPSKQFLPISF